MDTVKNAKKTFFTQFLSLDIFCIFSIVEQEKCAEESEELKRRLNDTEVLLSEQGEAHGRVEAQLRDEIGGLNEKIRDLSTKLEHERAEKANIVLKNAEISQSEEILKQSLREEQDEISELTEKMMKLKTELKER